MNKADIDIVEQVFCGRMECCLHKCPGVVWPGLEIHKFHFFLTQLLKTMAS